MENWRRCKTVFGLWVILSFAVFVAALFSIISFLLASSVTWNIIEINRGHVGFVELPDSSTVNLNAATTLKVSSTYRQTAIIYLDGEALFDFRKANNQKVILKTSIGEIWSNGNLFNVTTYNDDLAIACLQGTIFVKPKKGGEQLLKEGFALKYDADKKGWTTIRISPHIITSWTTGTYFLDEEKLENICRLIERVYDVHIVLDKRSARRCRFTGKFVRNEPVTVILEQLSEAGGLSYHFDNTGMIHLQ